MVILSLPILITFYELPPLLFFSLYRTFLSQPSGFIYITYTHTQYLNMGSATVEVCYYPLDNSAWIYLHEDWVNQFWTWCHFFIFTSLFWVWFSFKNCFSSECQFEHFFACDLCMANLQTRKKKWFQFKNSIEMWKIFVNKSLYA